jgi:hypothetical protein
MASAGLRPGPAGERPHGGEGVALDLEGLLLSRRRIECTRTPFCFFSVDDYLPSDVYRALEQSFPDDAWFMPEKDYSGKLGFRSSVVQNEFERFCAAHPLWARLIEFFGSDLFLEDLRRVFLPDLVRARGLAGRKPWVNYTRRQISDNPLRYLLEEPVRTTFQFSRLPDQAVVIPHTDAPRKLVSLLLYFWGPQWQDAFGGATDFYEPRDPERARRWSATERIPFEELREIGSTPFVANRLAGFVRSPCSYHGVRPIACPPGTTRNSLLVNVKRLKWSKRHSP